MKLNYVVKIIYSVYAMDPKKKDICEVGGEIDYVLIEACSHQPKFITKYIDRAKKSIETHIVKRSNCEAAP